MGRLVDFKPKARTAIRNHFSIVKGNAERQTNGSSVLEIKTKVITAKDDGDIHSTVDSHM